MSQRRKSQSAHKCRLIRSQTLKWQLGKYVSQVCTHVPSREILVTCFCHCGKSEKKGGGITPPDTPDFMEDHTLPLDACKLAAGPQAVGCKIHSQSLSKKRLENGHFCCFLLAESGVCVWGDSCGEVSCAHLRTVSLFFCHPVGLMAANPTGFQSEVV